MKFKQMNIQNQAHLAIFEADWTIVLELNAVIRLKAAPFEPRS